MPPQIPIANNQFAVPESATVSGEVAALLVICSVAVWLPAAIGAYDIPITQFAPAARLVPQVLLCKLKSVGFVPARAMLLIASVLSPVFESVTDCGMEVVPCVRSGKVSEVGESETIGPPPIPVMDAVVACPSFCTS